MLIGIFFIAIGIYRLYKGFDQGIKTDGETVCTATYYEVAGILLIIAVYTLSEFIQMVVLFVALWGIFIVMGLYHCWRIFVCQTPVVATCVDLKCYYAARGIELYTPVFTYEFRGRNYEGSSGELFNRYQIDQLFQSGCSYIIYVRENAACSFVTGRRFRRRDICMVVGGCLAIIASTFIYWLSLKGMTV